MRHARRAFPGWWTVGLAATAVLLVLGAFIAGQASLVQVIATAMLAAFVVVVAALAEAHMALQSTRLRALEKLARQRTRELTVYADHATRAINDIRRVSPKAADEHSAALTLDLTRLHAHGVNLHRQEHRG